MAEIQNVRAFVGSEQTETSTTFTDVAGATVTIAGGQGGTYLLICTAQIGGSNRNRTFRFRLAKNGTEIDGTEMVIEPYVSGSTSGGTPQTRDHYGYMGSAAYAAGDVITFQMKAVNGADTALSDMIQIIMIRTDVDLVTGTDIVYGENTTITSLTTTGVDFADTGSFTTGAEDWLVIAHCRFQPRDKGVRNSMAMTLNRDSEAELEPLVSREGEDSLEFLGWITSRTFSLSAGSHRFQVQASVSGTSGGGLGARHDESHIVAIRLNRFDRHASDYVSIVVDITTPTSVATAAVGTGTAAAALYLHSARLNGGAGSSALFWTERPLSTVEPTNSDQDKQGVSYDDRDRPPVSNIYVNTAFPAAGTAASRTVTSRADGDASPTLIEHSALTVVSLELPAVGDQTIFVEAASLTATGIEPGFSFGNINVAVEAASLATQAPALTPAPGNLNTAVEAASVALTGLDPTVALGGINVSVEAASLALSAPAITVDTSGPQTILVEAASLSLSAPAITVALGNINVAVEAAALTLTAPAITVVPVLTVTVEAASLTATAPALGGIALGGITVSVEAGTLTLQAPVITVDAAAGLSLVFFHQTLGIVNPATDYPPGAVYTLEVVLSQDAVGTIVCRLHNFTDGLDIAGSEVTTTNTAPTQLESGALTLTAGTKSYRAFFGGEAGGLYRCHMARIKVRNT